MFSKKIPVDAVRRAQGFIRPGGIADKVKGLALDRVRPRGADVPGPYRPGGDDSMADGTLPYAPGSAERPLTASSSRGFDSNMVKAKEYMERFPNEGYDEPGKPYQPPATGEEPLEAGKQEKNQRWRYSNSRAERKNPIPEDRQRQFDKFYDDADGAYNGVVGTGGKFTEGEEFSAWRTKWLRKARAYGLSPEEAEEVIDDIIGNNW